MPFSFFSSAEESHQFPPKPLRESQNRLLNNGQSEGSEDRDKRGDRPHLRSIQNTANLSVLCALTIDMRYICSYDCVLQCGQTTRCSICIYLTGTNNPALTIEKET